MKLLIFTFLIVLLCADSFAQNKDTIFYNSGHYHSLDTIASMMVARCQTDKNNYCKCYNKNEQVIREGYYIKKFVLIGLKREELKQGVWKYYNDDNKLILEETYKKGKLLLSKGYE